MTEEKNRQKEIEILIKDLNSGDDRKITGALKKIPEAGSPEMIEPLFALYLDKPSGERLQLLEKVVHRLKDPNCVQPIISLLESPSYKDVYVHLLNAIWQSGLDVTDHVELIVDIAIDGDFMTILEASTVIDQMEIDDERALTEAVAALDEVINQKSDTAEILGSLRQVLLSKLLGEA